MKNKRISIRVTPAEREQLLKESQLSKMNFSEYVRKLLLNKKVIINKLTDLDKEYLSVLNKISNDFNKTSNLLKLAFFEKGLNDKEHKEQILDLMDKLKQTRKLINKKIGEIEE